MKISRTILGSAILAPALALGQTPPQPAEEPMPAVATPEPGIAPASPPAAGPPPTTVDRLELDPTSIIGNKELPKVMVIVPWKRSDIGDLTGRPANSLLNEVLTPVDRDVFRRELRYFEAVRPAEPATPPEPET